METIQVPLRRDVFEKLQKLAVPLVDDINAVIERLIKQSMLASAHGGSIVAAATSVVMWRSARGESLPVGLPLRAFYLGKPYAAKVTEQGIEFNGEIYDSPSAAGIAVKISVGTTGKAASTNGWDFWEALDSETQRWLVLKDLRTKYKQQ